MIRQISYSIRDRSPRKIRRSSKNKWFFIFIASLIIIISLNIYGYRKIKVRPKVTISSVPEISQSLKQSVPFDIYYPDQNKLPKGYVLDKNSLSTSKHAVVYTIKFESNKKLVVTVQAKSSDKDISDFYAHTMPLHIDVNTPIGKATIGAINLKNVVSLPTKTNSWLIISVPADTNQDQLKNVLQSFKKN